MQSNCSLGAHSWALATLAALAGCSSTHPQGEAPRGVVPANDPLGSASFTQVAATAGTSTTPAPAKAAAPVEGEEPEDLLDVLLGNGSLTQEQYDSLSAKAEADKPAEFTIDAKGLRFKSPDGEYSMKIGGRLQVEGNWHEGESDDARINDGTELRRARFELKGTMPHNLLWAAEVDFGSGRELEIKDFWMGVDADNGFKTTLGHQKTPYSLSVEMSSNDLPWVERSVDIFLLAPYVDRAIGVRTEYGWENTFIAGGLYGEGARQGSMVDDEGWGLATRLVHAPVHNDNQVVHLCARGAYRQPDDGLKSTRIRDESTHMSNYRVVDTGLITDVDGVTLYGAEVALTQGPVTLLSEYNRAEIDREGSNLGFNSWHVEGTYTLTGESRAKAYRMDPGEYKRLRAKEDSSHGAWELATRLAAIDLNDSDISGGAEEVFSVGVNWYYTPNVRFMLDWSKILDTSGGSMDTADAEGVSFVQFRAQLTF